MAYEFHYTPTGTGVISGKEVLEQTEDAINDLGNTAISGVQEALDKAEQALTNSENAVDDAQTALNTANNAEGVAIQAQTDVSNLSGTVTNIGNRVTTAEGNISNLQGRMTTAEGNVTNLQGRMTTAEGNIGNLQTAVSTAQATANSAQQTATTARQQSYVFRYSSTALTPSSTNSNALLDNTDNLKVGDKVIDSSGVLFSVTAIDTQNSTFTIGTALIDLAQDSDVVHKSGNETVGGVKTFSDNPVIGNNNTNITISNRQIIGNTSYSTPTGNTYSYTQLKAMVNYIDSSPSIDATVVLSAQENAYSDGKSKSFYPNSNNLIDLGLPDKHWANVYATNYYYGSNNVEFSTKFVTTDTAQTVVGQKTWSDNQTISSASNKSFAIQNTAYTLGESTPSTNKVVGSLAFKDYNNDNVAYIDIGHYSSGDIFSRWLARHKFNNRVKSITGATVNVAIDLGLTDSGNAFLRPFSNGTHELGTSTNKWKTFNGLEPSALSLPATRDNAIDISSYFTNFNNGDTNQYTPTVNGWVYLETTGCNALHCFCTTTNNLVNYGNTVSRANDGMAYVTFPVLANTLFKCTWYSNTTITLSRAWFIPCQGNV